MKISISEVAKLTKISVRTLHYYDEIGLLSPSIVTVAGYRYYDKLALERLQQILFYRELDFSLKEIMNLLNVSAEKKGKALQCQKELLILKRKRLNKLIHLLDENMEGENRMDFNDFDMSDISKAKEKYAKEVKEKWGTTAAYAQSEKKTNQYSKEDWETIMRKSDAIIENFSKRIGYSPESKEVQELVVQWQNHITEYYYECTKEILMGLAVMYVQDERFLHAMDKFKEVVGPYIIDCMRYKLD